MGKKSRVKRERASEKAIAIPYMVSIWDEVVAASRVSPDCCILATRVVLDVCDHYGIRAEPVPVVTFIFNEAMQRHLEAGEVLTPENAVNWLEQDGSWSMGIGVPREARPGRWQGHLVAWIPQTSVLVDLVLGNCSRLERGITLRPSAFFIDSHDFFSGKTHPFQVGTNLVTYQHNPQADPSWKLSPDWRDGESSTSLSTYLIDRIHEKATA